MVAMGRKRDPGYWRNYRATHPAYRECEHQRRRARRARMTPEQRRRDRAPATSPPVVPPMPALHQGSELFDEARRVAAQVGAKPDLRNAVYDAYYDDLVGEIVLALVEHIEPFSVAMAYRTTERRWRYRHQTGVAEEYEFVLENAAG